MTKLRRLVSISILMVSLVGVALADGGETQGPPAPPPPPVAECIGCSEPEAAEPAQSQDWSVDIVTEATLFASWLAMSIF